MPFHKGCCKYRDKKGNLSYRVLFFLKKKSSGKEEMDFPFPEDTKHV